MAKDPAFLFYASDFLTGVSGLTMDERGQYITLLCLQHQTGHLSEKEIRLCVGNAAADVLAKFEKDENGKFFNKRLDIEIAKRKAHSEKQRIRAVEGWEKRKSHGIATALPLEDENRNRNIDDNVIEIKNKKSVKKNSVVSKMEIVALSPQFQKYEDWAKRNLPDLLEFRQPLENSQLLNLLDEFDKTLVLEKLEAIGITVGAIKKYKSVYFTCKNWCKLAIQKGWKPANESGAGQDVWSKAYREITQNLKEKYNVQNQIN